MLVSQTDVPGSIPGLRMFFYVKFFFYFFFLQKINDKEGIRTLASGDIALAGQPIKTTLAPYQNICYFLYIGCIYDVIYKEISCKI